MVVSIGPEDARISQGQIKKPKINESKSSDIGLARASLKTTPPEDSAPKVSGRQEQSRQASAAVLRAATEVTVRDDLAQNLKSTLNDLKDLATRSANETDPTKKQDLQAEADRIISDAQTRFDNAAVDNPNLGETTTFTAVVNPGNPNTESTVVSISVAAGVSPANTGLTGLTLANPEQAASAISNAQDIVNSKVSQLQSTTTAIQQTIQTRGLTGQAQDSQRAASAAEAAANRAPNATEIFNATGPIEKLDIKSLLQDPEEVASARRDAPPPSFQELGTGRAQLHVDSDAPKDLNHVDNATLSRQAVGL